MLSSSAPDGNPLCSGSRAGLPWLCTDVWISLSKVSVCYMPGEREGERDSERPPTPSTPPFFFFSSSKTQSAQTLHGDCGRGLLISQQHRHVKEELEVIGLRSGIYSIRLCLKCSLSFFFPFSFLYVFEKRKINKVRHPLAWVTWVEFLQ